MSNCNSCGFPLPVGAEYCPNCGKSVVQKKERILMSAVPLGRILQAAFTGAILSVMVSYLIVGVQLYFLPSFFASLVSIYFHRARRLDESILIALSVYLVSDAILGGLFFVTLYAEGISLSQAYEGYFLTLADVIMYTIDPFTSFAAGYIGYRLTSKGDYEEKVPLTYERREEGGGIVCTVKTKLHGFLHPSPHKI